MKNFKINLIVWIARTVAVIVMLLAIRFVYIKGIEQGSYTGWKEGYETGYEAGYNEGEWYGKISGAKSANENWRELILYTHDHGYFTEEINGKTYRVYPMQAGK